MLSASWDGLPEQLPDLLKPLSIRVFIVERPAPGWVRVELLDLRDRPLGLRLRLLGQDELGLDQIELRCSAGRFGDQDLEVEILDAIMASAD